LLTHGCQYAAVIGVIETGSPGQITVTK